MRGGSPSLCILTSRLPLPYIQHPTPPHRHTSADDPTNGTPLSSSNACNWPSSPNSPCMEGNTTSTDWARRSARDSRAPKGVTVWTA